MNSPMINNLTSLPQRFVRWPRAIFSALPVLALSLWSGGFPAHADNDRREHHREPELPAPICDTVNVPEGHRLVAHVYAVGVQIYRWTGTSWTFIAPEASLYADPCYDREIGTHYAGPTWEARDGSKVVGSRLGACSPNRGAIPWLLLSANSAPERGIFSRLSYIQRVNTVGGTAPAEPGSFVGDEARVPYSTEYYFYRAHR